MQADYIIVLTTS